MDLYAMTAEGTGVRRLTDAPATEIAPVWSPDGTKIAFLSFQEAFDSVDAEVSPGQIKIMDADGSNVRELTAPEPQTGGITWAPDGDRIAFAAPGGQIDVIRVDGSGRRRLAKVGRAAYWPSWSPDGKRIVVTSPSPTGEELWTVQADGTGAEALSEPGSEAVWSPDGRRIAFASSRTSPPPPTAVAETRRSTSPTRAGLVS